MEELLYLEVSRQQSKVGKNLGTMAMEGHQLEWGTWFFPTPAPHSILYHSHLGHSQHQKKNVSPVPF